MKTHSDSMFRLFRRDSMNPSGMDGRSGSAGGSSTWSRRADSARPGRAGYPPPVYRRDEDLYVIGFVPAPAGRKAP